VISDDNFIKTNKVGHATSGASIINATITIDPGKAEVTLIISVCKEPCTIFLQKRKQNMLMGPWGTTL